MESDGAARTHATHTHTHTHACVRACVRASEPLEDITRASLDRSLGEAVVLGLTLIRKGDAKVTP